jgi:hypothetical protein
MLTLVMHRMLKAMDGRDFARFLRAFLPPARKAWCSVRPRRGRAPVDDRRTAARVQSACRAQLRRHAGLGPRFNARGWRATRARYFALNWVRAAATWAAFALFLAALVEQLR